MGAAKKRVGGGENPVAQPESMARKACKAWDGGFLFAYTLNMRGNCIPEKGVEGDYLTGLVQGQFFSRKKNGKLGADPAPDEFLARV